MKKIFFSFLFTFSAIVSVAQINNGYYEIINSIYTGFNGVSHDVYLIETNFCVVQIEISEITDEQLQDTETIIKILNRIDALYNYYKTNLPNEPDGGNENYLFKTNVFFGPPSCGAGCGLVGSKGIEVSGFENIFFNIKYNLNVNADVIIAYEFGRNFSNNGINKIALPFEPNTDEKNGGFYEGFAAIMTTNAFNEIITDPSERHLNETLMNLTWDLEKFRGYINDLDATPYNTIHLWEKLGVQDPNRGHDGWNIEDPSYTGGSFLRGTLETFGINTFDFAQNLLDLEHPMTVEDALSNFSLAASRSINADLSYFFENVMKFTLNEDAVNEISSLPPLDDMLIIDQPILWFVSPFDQIPLNIRSINYLKDENTSYRLLVDGEVYSESQNGNNLLEYSILHNAPSKTLQVQLLNNGNIVDAYSIELKKRHNINILDYSNHLYSYYSSNPFHLNYEQNGTLVLDALDEDLSGAALVYYNFNFSRDRIYRITSEILHNSAEYIDQIVGGLNTSGFSTLGYAGPYATCGSVNNPEGWRVGYDMGGYNNQEFFQIYSQINSNCNIPDQRDYFMSRFYFVSEGYNVFAEFKNILFEDITDTDGDGVIDFEDNCPSTSNPDQLDSNNDGIGDVCNQTASINEFEQIQMTVFPNPSHSNWAVRTPNNLIQSVDLFTLFGTKVLSLKLNNNSVEISNKLLSSGVYFLKVKTDAGSKTLKLIKQ